MGRRTLLLIVSILIAAVGTGLIGLYVRGADQRAQANEAQVSVLVAKTDVASGTSVSAAIKQLSFGLEERPSKLVDGSMWRGGQAITTFQGDYASKYAKTEILKGQIIQPAMFGGQNEASESGIPPDKMALQIQLGDPNRVSGLLVPNSLVNIYYTTTQGGSDSQSKTPPKAKQLFPSVQVLGVGNNVAATDDSPTGRTTTSGSAGSRTENVSTALVTLLVTEPQAEQIIGAQAVGDLYFTLLPGK